MPMTFKHSGKRLQVTATAARTSGALVVDPFVASGANTVFGIAQANATTAEAYWIETEGVHNITVPGGTVPGTLLYAPGNAGSGAGTGPTAGNGIVLTASSSSNTLVGKTISAVDTTGRADVILLKARY